MALRESRAWGARRIPLPGGVLCGDVVRVVLVLVFAGRSACAQTWLDEELLRRFVSDWAEGKRTSVYMPGVYQPGGDINGDGLVDYRDAVVVVENALRGPAVISDKAKVLPDDGSVTVEVIDDRHVRLKGAVPALSRGDVIVTGLGGGLLRKVDLAAVQPDGSVLITTSPTGLAQIIKRGAFQVGFIAPSEAPIIWAQGVRSQQVKPATLGAGIDLGGVTLAATADGRTYVRFTSGRLYFQPRISIGATFEDWSLEEFHALVSGSVDVGATVRLENPSGQLATSAEIQLCTVHLPWIVVWIGDVPVYFHPQLEFSAGFELSSRQFRTIEHSCSAHFQSTLGARYENGTFSPVCEHQEDGGIVICQLDINNGAQVIGKFFVKCEVGVYVYGVLGPSMALCPYLKGELTIPAEGRTYGLCAYFGADCDVAINLSIFDILKLSWSKSVLELSVPLGCVEGAWSGGVFPPRVVLSPEDFWIPEGGTTRLHWSAVNATKIVSSNFGATTFNGSVSVAPSRTTEYELTVEGLGGRASARTVVVVGDDTGEGGDSKGLTMVVSRPVPGGEADAASYQPSISADGRYVAFESDASNLVDDDTNACRDIFVYDRLTGAVERVSISDGGAQANGWSYSPCMTSKGFCVAFVSSSTNLVARDTNGVDDVFLRDRIARRTLRVSVSSSGQEANGMCWQPAIAASGRYVAFASLASNLVPGDTNNCSDVFVRDVVSGRTVRVSVASNGEQGNAASWGPSLSADGRYVAFISAASNLVAGDTNGIPDYFVHDCLTGQTIRVSVSSSGEQADRPWTESTSPPVSAGVAISADGRYVTFVSASANLVPGDRNYCADVFVHDLLARQTTRASVSSDGEEGGWPSYGASISADGRYVAFVSKAQFVVGDVNGQPDVFVHDLQTRQTTRVSVETGGRELGSPSWSASINSDGQFLAFSCGDRTLVGLPGSLVNIFLHYRPWLGH